LLEIIENSLTDLRSFLSLTTSAKSFKQNDPAKLQKKKARPVSKKSGSSIFIMSKQNLMKVKNKNPSVNLVIRNGIK